MHINYNYIIVEYIYIKNIFMRLDFEKKYNINSNGKLN